MTMAQPASTRTERPWGWFEHLGAGPGHLVKRLHLRAGQRISLQRHALRREHWVVVLGVAQVTLDQSVMELGPGQHCDIALGQVHRLANPSMQPLEVIEVQWGEQLSEEDIERLQDDFGRAPS